MYRFIHFNWLAVALLGTFLFLNTARAQQMQADIQPPVQEQYRQFTTGKTHDSNNILRMIASGLQLQDHLPDSAFSIFSTALQQSKESFFFNGIASSLLQMGNMYARQGLYEKSLTIFHQAIPYCTDSEQGKQILSSLYNNIALIYHKHGDAERAAKYYYRGTRIVENYSSSLTMGHIYNNLGMELNQIGKSEHALYYLNEAEKIARDKNHYKLLGNVTINKGVFYGNRGDWEKSNHHYQTAFQLGEKNKLIELQHIALTNIGFNYLMRDMPGKALPYLIKAGEIPEKIDPFYKNSSDVILGEVYYKLGRYEQAEKVLLETMEQARTLSLNKNLIEIHQILAALYAKVNRHRQAFHHQQVYMQLKDSLMNAETAKNINHLEIKYRTARQQQEIAEKQLMITLQNRRIEKKNRVIGGITAGSLTLTALAFGVYQYKQRLQKKKIQILEQEHEISQLKAIMEGAEKERTRIARELHDGIVSQLLAVRLHFNATLQNRQAQPLRHEDFADTLEYLDDATRELRKTAHNLMPETVLQGGLVVALDAFCRKLDQGTDPEISVQSIGTTCRLDPDIELSIFRIMQELIQNALKHAQAKHILAQLNWQGSLLSITIEDDGIGYPKGSTARKGMGMNNVYTRVKALNGHIDITGEAGTGTAIYLEFNINPVKELPPYAYQSNYYR